MKNSNTLPSHLKLKRSIPPWIGVLFSYITGKEKSSHGLVAAKCVMVITPGGSVYLTILGISGRRCILLTNSMVTLGVFKKGRVLSILVFVRCVNVSSNY